MNRIFLILSAFFFFASGPHMALAQTADEILTESIEAMGGAKQWKSLKNFSESGKLKSFGLSGSYKSIQASPNKYLYSQIFGGVETIEAFDGETFWTLNPLAGSTKPQEGTEEQTKEAKEKDLLHLIFNYRQLGMTAKILDDEFLMGEICTKIELKNDKGDITNLFVGKDSKLLKGMTVPAQTVDGVKTGSLKTYYSDYKDIDGLKFPFNRQLYYEYNGEITEILYEVEEIIVNGKLAKDEFSMP